MGTRADFYVGRGPEADWLGSVSWDGDPSGIAHASIEHGYAIFVTASEEDYRAEVAAMLAHRDDATLPTEFWPWPWDDSGTTDYAYAFEDGVIYASSFGHPWFVVDLDAENCGEPDEEDEVDNGAYTVFPDMSARRGTYGQVMGRSGLIRVSFPEEG